jgi:transposase
MDAKDQIIAELGQEIVKLRQENQFLREEIARLKKNSGNSSLPPSSDIVKPTKITHKLLRKLRRGGQHGHRKISQPFASEDVDQTIEYELKAKDAKGLMPLDEWLVIQQIVLPEKMHKVIEHKAGKYLDPAAGKMHIAPMPQEIRKGGMLGADVTALIAFMKGGCHMSFSTIKKFFREIKRLDISPGMLCKTTQKVSKSLEASYNKLARRFEGEHAEDYFRFLTDPGIKPTNNGTEQEIRYTVIDRRITQGTRGHAGMR